MLHPDPKVDRWLNAMWVGDFLLLLWALAIAMQMT